MPVAYFSNTCIVLLDRGHCESATCGGGGTALELNLAGRCARRTPADGKIGIKLRVITEIRMVSRGFVVCECVTLVSFNNLSTPFPFDGSTNKIHFESVNSRLLASARRRKLQASVARAF